MHAFNPRTSEIVSSTLAVVLHCIIIMVLSYYCSSYAPTLTHVVSCRWHVLPSLCPSDSFESARSVARVSSVGILSLQPTLLFHLESLGVFLSVFLLYIMHTPFSNTDLWLLFSQSFFLSWDEFCIINSLMLALGFLIMCMDVFPACMYVYIHHITCLVPMAAREGMRSPGTGD